MNIVITGISRGLGKALLRELARGPHTIAGCARDRDSIATLQTEWPSPHRFQVVDVSCPDQVARWAADYLSVGGAPDLLINNAAVISPNRTLWETDVADFSRVVDINIKGVFHVIKNFVPAMVARRRGVIANISSGWGRSTSPEVAPYCASKWAIEGLTQSLAQELPAGMAAVAVNPGIIDTDMLRSCFGAQASQYPSPERWAVRAASFLCGLGPQDNGQALTIPSP